MVAFDKHHIDLLGANLLDTSLAANLIAISWHTDEEGVKHLTLEHSARLLRNLPPDFMDRPNSEKFGDAFVEWKQSEKQVGERKFVVYSRRLQKEEESSFHVGGMRDVRHFLKEASKPGKVKKGGRLMNFRTHGFGIILFREERLSDKVKKQASSLYAHLLRFYEALPKNAPYAFTDFKELDYLDLGRHIKQKFGESVPMFFELELEKEEEDNALIGNDHSFFSRKIDLMLANLKLDRSIVTLSNTLETLLRYAHYAIQGINANTRGAIRKLGDAVLENIIPLKAEKNEKQQQWEELLDKILVNAQVELRDNQNLIATAPKESIEHFTILKQELKKLGEKRAKKD